MPLTRHTPLMKLRTEMILFGLMIGPIMLLVGCSATFVAIFDPPSQDSEQAAVTGVGFLGLIAGVGFLSLALPQRWGAPSWLWKHLGWLGPLSIVPLALMMMVFSEEAARQRSLARAHPRRCVNLRRQPARSGLAVRTHVVAGPQVPPRDRRHVRAGEGLTASTLRPRVLTPGRSGCLVRSADFAELRADCTRTVCPLHMPRSFGRVKDRLLPQLRVEGHRATVPAQAPAPVPMPVGAPFG